MNNITKDQIYLQIAKKLADLADPRSAPAHKKARDVLFLNGIQIHYQEIL